MGEKTFKEAQESCESENMTLVTVGDETFKSVFRKRVNEQLKSPVTIWTLSEKKSEKFRSVLDISETSSELSKIACATKALTYCESF